MFGSFDFQEFLSAFIVLFAVIDIIGSIPIILNLKQKGRNVNANKATGISFALLIGFFYAGDMMLKLFQVDIASFAVAGAFVIFLMSLEMILDIEIFKKAFGDKFVLVDVVVSDDEVRYQRMLARGSERDGKSVEKLRENDLHEEEIFHTSESEKMADYILKNDGGVEDFYAAVTDFYDNYLKEKLD